MTPDSATRSVAFYLPQFHAVRENDEWWEPGFTEWTNVKRARPLFSGHEQPIAPDSELGYYDLLNPDVLTQQMKLASKFGIDAFCFWHYWFGNGRRILEKPVDRLVLGQSEAAIPFCLCWANESWTGVWHGAPNRLLVEQTYPGVEDLRQHSEYLTQAFSHPNYLRVGGKPVFVIYSPGRIPNLAEYIQLFREALDRAGGGPVHLIGMTNLVKPVELRNIFDQLLPFGPGDYLDARPLSPLRRLTRRVACHPLASALPPDLKLRLGAPLKYNYSDVVAAAFSSLDRDPTWVPCVLTGWDNTPRSGRRGIVIDGFEPELLTAYVEKAIEFNRQKGLPNDLIFFKAWNEWAEGNILEPTSSSQTSSLEAVQLAFSRL